MTSPKREAPTLVMSADEGKFWIYCERYPYYYELYTADSIESDNWTSEPFEGPKARHGCVVRVSEAEYQSITSTYKN